MKFASFSRHLSPQVQTIGVVTQPFSATGQVRVNDNNELRYQRCRKVVYAFLDHLEETFPHAKIRLHNSADENIALMVTRVVMANQTVIGASSIGGFAGVASFGQAFIRNPRDEEGPNQWMRNTTTVMTQMPHVTLINEPRLSPKELAELWGEDGGEVLRWFRNYDDIPGGGSDAQPRPRDENHQLLAKAAGYFPRNFFLKLFS